MKISRFNRKDFSILKAKHTALYILLIYCFVQLSGAFFYAPLYHFIEANHHDLTKAELTSYAKGWYIFISMGVGVLLSALVILRDRAFLKTAPQLPIGRSIIWGVAGFILLLIGQNVGNAIERMLGITTASTNTSNLIAISEIAPILIIATVLFAPILEELIFRRIVFSWLQTKMNIWFAACISALFFALMHNDFDHLLIYWIMGMILAFLYKKTGRILTPIVAHILLNSLVIFS